jgi:membrane protein required for colicin V production
MVDILIVALVVATTLVGYLRGVLRAVLWLAAIVVAHLATRALMPGLARLMGPALSTSPVAMAGAYIVVGLVVFCSVMAAGQILNRRLGHTERGDVRPWNRRLGAVAGLAAGLVLALVVLLGLDTFAAMTAPEAGGFAGAVHRSRLRRAVSDHNPLRDYLLPEALEVLARARRDPQVLDDLREEPHIQELLQHPDVRAVIEDEELREAVENRNLEVLSESEKLRKLYANKELRARLFSEETREALQRVREKAEERNPEPEAAAGADSTAGEETP